MVPGNMGRLKVGKWILPGKIILLQLSWYPVTLLLLLAFYFGNFCTLQSRYFWVAK